MSSPGRSVLRFVDDEAARDALLGAFRQAGQTTAAAGGKVLVMLASQRVACIYEMLAGGGEIERFDPDRFEVVGSLAADTGRVVCAGRRVVLIDDAARHGDSLARRCDELRDQVGDRGAVTVLAALRDKDRASPAAMQRLGIRPEEQGGPLERSSAQLDDWALQTATCLYRSLTPLCADLPALKPIDAPAAAVDELLATRRWLTADVTAPIAGAGQRACTLVPAAGTEDLIRSKAPAALMEIAELLKVRLWAAAPQAGVRRLRVVPVGAPAAAMPAQLDAILHALPGELLGAGDAGVRWERWRPRGKHRLLQWLISACVAAEFWHDLTEAGAATGELGPDCVEEGLLRLCFGPDADAAVAAFGRAAAVYRDADAGGGPPVRDPFPFEPESALRRDPTAQRTMFLMRGLISGVEPPEPPPGDTTRLAGHMIWVQRVLTVFAAAEGQATRPAGRSEARSPAAASERLGRRTADGGVRLGELARAVTGAAGPGDVWRRALPSLALDIGIDLGVAVPATADNGRAQPVFRQYQPGRGAFLVGKPHNRLRDAGPQNVASRLDYLTRHALEQTRPADVTETGWALAEAARIRRAIPDVCLLQRWVGQVVEVEDGWFTADFVTTIGGEDVERGAFRAAETLNGPDRESLGVGAIVEWLVYGPDDTAPEGTSRVMRVTHPPPEA